MKIILAQINPVIGSIEANSQKIIDEISVAKKRGFSCVVFPEMAITGYPPEDLLILPEFIHSATEHLDQIVEHTVGMTAIVGCIRLNPAKGEKSLFNSAALIHDKQLLGFHDKILLPDYDVFSERRYFEPGGEPQIWEIGGLRIAITICEDIWQHAEAVQYSSYQRDPIREIAKKAPDLLINLSASPYYLKRIEMRRLVCQKAAHFLKCPLLLCNQVGGNDSLIFDGYSIYMDAHGSIVKCAKGFEEDRLEIDTSTHPKPMTIHMDEIGDLYRALVLGVRDYFHKLGWKKACLGISGGIDSAVVAVIATEALGAENMLALSLPSRFSSLDGREDAKILSERLKINFHEISIEPGFEAYLNTLAPYFKEGKHDITEENLQSRIRGTLLMAFSNKFGYIVLSTGNKSEMALGYTTLYGDMCGGLAVLSDVTKKQVYALASWMNHQKKVIPQSIIEREPSAELRFNQKDKDSLPEYAMIDGVLEDYIEEHLSIDEIIAKRRFPPSIVKDLVRKIHLNEYKRRQAPLGLRVSKKAFSAGRRYPIVHNWNSSKNHDSN